MDSEDAEADWDPRYRTAELPIAAGVADQLTDACRTSADGAQDRPSPHGRIDLLWIKSAADAALAAAAAAGGLGAVLGRRGQR